MKKVSLENAIFVGKGREREAYIHPEYPNRVIKVVCEGQSRAQNDREIKYFKRLAKRLPDTEEAWKHLPRFYGVCNTDRGKCPITEVIRDFDGEVSKCLEYYIEKNGVDYYRKELNELKAYFLKYLVIFCHDLHTHNILLQRKSETEQVLVPIDSIGDVVAIPILNIFPSSVRRKINRRWERFERKSLNSKNRRRKDTLR